MREKNDSRQGETEARGRQVDIPFMCVYYIYGERSAIEKLPQSISFII